MTFTTLLGIIWIIFIAYWIFSVKGIKKDIFQKSAFLHEAIARIILVLIFILVAIFAPRVFSGLDRSKLFDFGPIVKAIGVAMCAVGIGFAIWARRHLGKNWSPHPAMKIGHELVTSGPYRYVRHPIYTGMIFALIGSALAVGNAIWFVVLIVAAILLIPRISMEERFMLQLFPDHYPAYKRKTKALIPFIW